MAYRRFTALLGVMVAASPISAAPPEQPVDTPAPAAAPDARYCLWVEAPTGTRLETVQCWTREEWAQQDVDVDKEWAKEGVRVLG